MVKLGKYPELAGYQQEQCLICKVKDDPFNDGNYVWEVYYKNIKVR